MAMRAGFLVAHFTDHDDVRVGPQKGAHGGGKGPADAGVHLHLAQPALGDFDRVFGCPDLAASGVDVADDRVQRSRLAAPRGADHEHQAVALFHHTAYGHQVGRTQANGFQWQGFGASQQAQHHVFKTARGGHGDHTQLDGRAAEAREVDLPVLRLAVLGDVHTGHDLDAGHHGKPKACGQLKVGRQFTINAQAHAHVLRGGLGFYVDVGSAVVDGLVNHRVDQAHQGVV